jgi:hypothetical protein
MVRWSVEAQTAWLPAMMAIQLLHGLTFALLPLANLRVLAETVPPRLAGNRADALSRGRVSAAVALLTLASGGLYAQFGGARVLGDGRVVRRCAAPGSNAARGVAVNLEFEPPSPLARRSRSLVVPQSQKTAASKASSLLGDQRFESGFLQRGVCCELIFRGHPSPRNGEVRCFPDIRCCAMKSRCLQHPHLPENAGLERAISCSSLS